MRFGKLISLTIVIGLAVGLLVGCTGDDSSTAGAESAEPAAAEPPTALAADPAPAPAEEPTVPAEAVPAPAQARTAEPERRVARLPETPPRKLADRPSASSQASSTRRSTAYARSQTGPVGFFTNSSRQIYDEELELVSGSATVRVPNQRYASVMEQLAQLGEVERRRDAAKTSRASSSTSKHDDATSKPSRSSCSAFLKRPGRSKTP